jgi:hypothetical protein
MGRKAIASGVAAAALLAAGCTPSTTSTPSTTTTTSTSGDLAGAPHVANPLDTSRFQNDPCASITAGQLAQLRIAGTTQTISGVGPGCVWTDALDATAASASVSYLTGGAGLSGVYSQRDNYAAFRELPPIDGYPAVYAPPVDQTADGTCDITVGASDSLAIDVQLTVKSGPYKKDPCTPNTQLAADVISNIKNTSS